MLGGYFAAQGILEFQFDFGSEIFNLFRGNGAFIARFHNARKKLGTVKNLSCIIFFDNDERNAFHDLVSRKTVLTG